MAKKLLCAVIAATWLLSGCVSGVPSDAGGIKVLAVESFLADIVQNVAGDLYHVESLIPAGVDPHGFEITPRDVAAIENSSVLFINGGGLEYWLDPVISSLENQTPVVSCSEGLPFRSSAGTGTSDPDPHFWLDPVLVISYVEKIEKTLSSIDPENASIYRQNALAYTGELSDLNIWIENKVSEIPASSRLLVTNHETLGYFADRYGFEIIGTILMSSTSSSMPSASALSELSRVIEANNVHVIFLEVDENPQLADQLASELGLQVITTLHTHSLSLANGPAPDYISMLMYDAATITEALK